MANNDPVELDCELINQSPKAYQIKVQLTSKKSKILWVPKSQAEVTGSRKGTKVTLPYWLADKEGLV